MIFLLLSVCLWGIIPIPAERCGRRNFCGYGTVCVNNTCYCQEGFGFIFKTAGYVFYCQDICSMQNSTCPVGSICGYFGEGVCTCDLNYKRSALGACEDFNECITDPCEANTICVNLPGSYRCDCTNGYSRVGTDRRSPCYDIDECERNSAFCGSTANCTNTLGSYSCRCPEGYNISNVDDNPACRPALTTAESCGIDGFCGYGTVCANDTCTCQEGFTRITKVVNVFWCFDMCSEQNRTCPAGSTCILSRRTWLCTCALNYKRSVLGVCEAERCGIDGFCGYGTVCANDTCTCQEGFTRITKVVNVFWCFDMCSEQNITCPAGSTCILSRRTWLCTCALNYKRSVLGVCEDFNECKVDQCGDNSVCKNLPGSHICECSNGYSNVGTDRRFTCYDIDECQMNSSICGSTANCTNTLGSYSCRCPEGYNISNVDDNPACRPALTTDSGPQTTLLKTTLSNDVSTTVTNFSPLELGLGIGVTCLIILVLILVFVMVFIIRKRQLLKKSKNSGIEFSAATTTTTTPGGNNQDTANGFSGVDIYSPDYLTPTYNALNSGHLSKVNHGITDEENEYQIVQPYEESSNVSYINMDEHDDAQHIAEFPNTETTETSPNYDHVQLNQADEQAEYTKLN